MRFLLFPSFLTLTLIVGGCASSVPESDDVVVASEISVVKGNNPVLFVGRSREDGQWILLTDERASREVMVYALFQDLAARDSTLKQVRDLPVGWKATRTARGAPWVRDEFSITRQMDGQGKAATSLDKSSRRKPGPSSQFSVTIFDKDEKSSNDRRISVQERSVAVWLVDRTDTRTSTLLWSDTLSSAANRSVDSLVRLCDLDTLKEVYSQPSTSGGKRFILSIWDVKKERSTTTQMKNYWLPSIYELCAYINSLLPGSHAMNLAFPEK